MHSRENDIKQNYSLEINKAVLLHGSQEIFPYPTPPELAVTCRSECNFNVFRSGKLVNYSHDPHLLYINQIANPF